MNIDLKPLFDQICVNHADGDWPNWSWPEDVILCVCSDCEKPFGLAGADSDKKPGIAVLAICGCDSGGIYAVYARCPHCDHRHNLL